MNKIFLSIFSLFLLAAGASFFIQIPPDPKTTWLASHMQLALSASMAIFYISSAIITLFATFRQKALGGILGATLKVFSLGLFLLGIGFGQVPFVVTFNLWVTPYFTKGIYWIPYALGLLLMVVGLTIAAKNYGQKAAIATFLILACCVLLRVMLFQIPFTPIFYSNPTEFQGALTVNTFLTAVSLFLLVFAILLRQSFGKSAIGSVFSIFTGAFVLNLIGGVFGYHVIILSGTTSWFYQSGLYFSLFLASSILFFWFSLKLRYFKI